MNAIETIRPRHLTCAETAKIVRRRLKDAFPGVRFSVRSSTYSMGASIDVKWTDGPTVDAVDAVTQPLRGADFDGMQDLKTYRDPIGIDGEYVSSGADYIFGVREISPAYAEQLAAALDAAAKGSGTGKPLAERDLFSDPVILRGDDGEMHVMRGTYADCLPREASQFIQPKGA